VSLAISALERSPYIDSTRMQMYWGNVSSSESSTLVVTSARSAEASRCSK
jgi:hypothetical protein